MSKLLIILFLGLSLVLAGCGNSKTVATLQDTSGATYQLQNYPNQWIVLNYWASWCKPCHEEIPQLNAFYEHYKKHILLFGVNYDAVGATQLSQLVKQMNILYPVLTGDPAATFGINEVPGLPVTFIINPKGQVVKTLFGKQTVQSLAKATGLLG
jgi:thiol-disulfide isomerase/thioredoxin